MPGLGDPFGPYPPGGPSSVNWSDGQCQLTLSGSSLLLSRFGGRWLWIGDEAREIPSAGISLPVTGLSSTTLYYVYARWSGRMALEASTAAYETDAITGHAVKAKDRTRRLVGMAYVTGGGAFANTAAQRFIRSYFNDPGASLLGSFSAVRSTSSTSYVELNTEIRTEFLIWTGETVSLVSNGRIYATSGSPNAFTSIGIDGVTAEDTFSAGLTSTDGVPYSVGLVKPGLTEGYHYATLLGKASASSVAWDGTGTAGTRCTLGGFLRRTG